MKEVKHIVVCPDNVTLGLGKPEWDIVLWFAPRVVNGKMVNSKLFYDTVATKSEAVKIAKTLHKAMLTAPITIVDEKVA
tara:strand:+ start:3836 stop:4072 length:237 start_codon:yes stop_codon:yes gene_type:complete